MAFSRPEEDLEALKGALEGDTAMFGALVRRHQAGVIGFCASMLPYGEGAEDAAQDVFIKAFKALETFRGEASFSTWLYRIAFNHCCNLRKSSIRRKTDSLEDLPYAVREKAAGRADPPRGGPELDALAAALARLPESYRALVALRLEGEDYRAMAGTLGLSLEAVRARLRRARLILRRELRHFLPDGLSNSTGDQDGRTL